MLKQHSHYVRHRRDCWGYLSGNCPVFPIKRRIMEHEYEEMIKDEFSDHGHLELVIRQGASLGLSAEEILKRPFTDNNGYDLWRVVAHLSQNVGRRFGGDDDPG